MGSLLIEIPAWLAGSNHLLFNTALIWRFTRGAQNLRLTKSRPCSVQVVQVDAGNGCAGDRYPIPCLCRVCVTSRGRGRVNGAPNKMALRKESMVLRQRLLETRLHWFWGLRRMRPTSDIGKLVINNQLAEVGGLVRGVGESNQVTM